MGSAGATVGVVATGKHTLPVRASRGKRVARFSECLAPLPDPTHPRAGLPVPGSVAVSELGPTVLTDLRPQRGRERGGRHSSGQRFTPECPVFPPSTRVFLPGPRHSAASFPGPHSAGGAGRRCGAQGRTPEHAPVQPTRLGPLGPLPRTFTRLLGLFLRGARCREGGLRPLGFGLFLPDGQSFSVRGPCGPCSWRLSCSP